MKNQRSFYIPKDATLIDAHGTDAAVYVYTNAKGQLCAIGFHGRAQKPDFNYRYSNEDKRAQAVARFIESRQAHANAQANYKAQRNQPSKLRIGDILVSSWGYDQTNIDFYEVTATRGERTVEIRKIAQTQEPTEWAQGIATPRPGEYLTQPQTYRVTYGESVTIASYASARKWDGRPRRYSSYA